MNVEFSRTQVFMGAQQELKNATHALFGMPYDGTCSFRPGTRFGPAAIRNVSEGIETYCPLFDRDLEEVRYADLGDLILPPGAKEDAIDLIERATDNLFSSGVIPCGLGGEHLVSLPLLRSAHRSHPGLVLIQFDAHLDLRDDYLGASLSHATVLRRITEFVNPARVLQVGPRSGTREEFQLSKKLGTYRDTSITPDALRNWVGDRPLYVTLDIDVLDPSLLPGTGTPEPGGVTFATLDAWIRGLSGCKWIGWDLVELSPDYDVSQVSSVVSAKLVRSLLFSSSASHC